MAGTAHTEDPDNRISTQIRRRIPPRAKPALRRVWALSCACRRLPRRTWALGRAVLRRRCAAAWAVGRGWFLRMRLVAWVRVIRSVRNDYRHFHGRMPSLLRPRRFTEKMQWRKLFELDPRFAVLTDKLSARDFVAARIGPGRQADLLWVGSDPDAIPFDRLVPPYVVKSTHGQGHTIIVRDNAALDAAAVRAAARGWLAHCHGTPLHEPAYIHLPRRLIVERLLRHADGTPPWERKVYVFGGRATIIRTNSPDANGFACFGAVHTPDWTPVPVTWMSPAYPYPPARPARLAEIIELAERLAAGLAHCRVDIFDCGDTLKVGELTLYSQSGMVIYSDPAFDFTLGAHWTIRWPMLRAAWAVAARPWEIRPPPT